MNKELYQKIVRTLTNFEHPEDAGITAVEATDEIYRTLVDVQNAIDDGSLRFAEEDNQ